MRLIARIIFGFNFVYQFGVGVVSLFLPANIVALYSGPTNPDNFLMSAFRILGANMLFGGIVSAYISWNPDKNPILLRLMGILSFLTLVCWGIVYFQKELPLQTLLLDIVVQFLILIVCIGYKPTK